MTPDQAAVGDQLHDNHPGRPGRSLTIVAISQGADGKVTRVSAQPADGWSTSALPACMPMTRRAGAASPWRRALRVMNASRRCWAARFGCAVAAGAA